MNKKGKSRLIKRNLTAGMLLILILSLSMVGVTYAWFTGSQITLQNKFTAGTVIVEAGDSQGELIIKDESEECKEIELEITSTGSKYSYVRAIFDGAWRAAYHSNTAEVTAYYTVSGETKSISSSDSAHYIDGSYTGEPLSSLVGTITPESWFTASDSTEQLLITPDFPVYSDNNGSTSSSVDNNASLTSASLLGNIDAQPFEVQKLSLSSSSGPPTVDGRFYGGGDNLKYIPIGVSERGSTLYYYLHGNVLYVAMVVNRSVNDNVFDGPVESPWAYTDYMDSAGWGSHRSFKRLSDSEDMEFTLDINCSGSETSWTWKQKYVDNNNLSYTAENWSSGYASGDSLPGSFNYTSSSSLVWNMNNSPWANDGDIDLGEGIWKSPYSEADKDDITLVGGYPANTNEPITYSDDFSWEWSMVYEYSVDLTDYIGNCADYTINLSGGNAHHSPAKSGGEDEPVDAYDWGDLPDGPYPTLETNNGPRHKIVIGGAYLGDNPPDAEPDGQPHPYALGDDLNGIDDEDGIELLTPLIPGYQAQFKVIAGTSGYLSAWIDFNESGTLTQVELVSIEAPVGVSVSPGTLGDYHLPEPGDYIITVEVPEDADDTVFSRWRYTNQPNQGGNAITGEAETGEVEDHAFDITNVYPGIELKKYVSVDGGTTYFDAGTMPGPVLTANNKPIFKFVVSNTGTVDMDIGSVEDNIFGTIYPNDTISPIILEPNESIELFYPNQAGNWSDTQWQEYQAQWQNHQANSLHVETGDVEIDFCDDVNNTGINDYWVKHTDGYYYYTKPLAPEGGQVKLCVKVRPIGVSEALEGYEFTDLKAYVDAVQASNDAVYKVWFEGNQDPGINFEPKP